MINPNDIIGLNPKKLGYKLLDPKILADPLDVQLILGMGPIIPVDNGGRSPLHLAARYGNLDVCKLLVAYGVEVNPQDNAGMAALHWAAFYGHLEIAKILIDAGAQVNLENSIYGSTALQYASGEGDLEMCLMLLKAGADITKKNRLNHTAWDYASLDFQTLIPELKP